MLAALATCLLALNLAEPSNTLSIGKDLYAPGPAVRLAGFLSNPVFSRDGQFLTFIDERPERSYAQEKQRIQRGEVNEAGSLVRFDLKFGTRSVLYSPRSGELLTDIQPVGKGGDVICTMTIGIPNEDQLTWRAIFCPVGEVPKIVADGIQAKSFQVKGSATERKAFILIVPTNAPVRTLLVTPDKAIEKTLPISAFQGLFLPLNLGGNPIVGLQSGPPDYKVSGLYELSFANGEATKLPVLPLENPDAIEQPLIVYDLEKRSPPDAERGLLPLINIIARPGREKESSSKLTVCQGAVTIVQESQNGLAFVYLQDEGFYLREMLKLERKGN